MSIKMNIEIECDQCNLSIENQNEVFCKRCFSGLEDCVRVLKKKNVETMQVKAEWVMDFIDGIDDVFKIERPYTFYVDIAAFFSPRNFVDYLNKKLKEREGD